MILEWAGCRGKGHEEEVKGTGRARRCSGEGGGGFDPVYKTEHVTANTQLLLCYY